MLNIEIDDTQRNKIIPLLTVNAIIIITKVF